MIFGFFLGYASSTWGVVESEVYGHPVEVDSCHAQLQTLVTYLKETAFLEGRTLTVEWRHDGAVVLRSIDFVQHMWCEGEEMHIDFDEPMRE